MSQEIKANVFSFMLCGKCPYWVDLRSGEYHNLECCDGTCIGLGDLANQVKARGDMVTVIASGTYEDSVCCCPAWAIPSNQGVAIKSDFHIKKDENKDE
jgi:hypothetical protein